VIYAVAKNDIMVRGTLRNVPLGGGRFVRRTQKRFEENDYDRSWMGRSREGMEALTFT
jgi:hypothetical protein